MIFSERIGIESYKKMYYKHEMVARHSVKYKHKKAKGEAAKALTMWAGQWIRERGKELRQFKVDFVESEPVEFSMDKIISIELTAGEDMFI